MKETYPDSTPDKQFSSHADGSRQFVPSAYTRDLVVSETGNDMRRANEFVETEMRAPSVFRRFCLASKGIIVVVTARPNLRIQL